MDDLPLFFEMIISLSKWDGKDVQLVRVRLRILLLEDLDGHRRTPQSRQSSFLPDYLYVFSALETFEKRRGIIGGPRGRGG